MNIPKFLVQTADKNLHGYYTLSVLLLDITFNKEEVQVYELMSNSLTVRYRPTTVEALKSSLCEGGNKTVSGGFCEESSCQACCPHDERDHGICSDCEHEEDLGVAIDRAMDSLEE